LDFSHDEELINKKGMMKADSTKIIEKLFEDRLILQEKMKENPGLMKHYKKCLHEKNKSLVFIYKRAHKLILVRAQDYLRFYHLFSSLKLHALALEIIDELQKRYPNNLSYSVASLEQFTHKWLQDASKKPVTQSEYLREFEERARHTLKHKKIEKTHEIKVRDLFVKIYAALEDKSKEVDHLERLLKLQPENLSYRARLKELSGQKSLSAESSLSLEKAFYKKPNDLELLRKLLEKSNGLKKFKNSQKLLNAASSKINTLPEYFLFRSEVLSSLGEIKDAESYLEKVPTETFQSPKNLKVSTQILNNFIRHYAQKKEDVSSLYYFKKLIQLRPSDSYTIYNYARKIYEYRKSFQFKPLATTLKDFKVATEALKGLRELSQNTEDLQLVHSLLKLSPDKELLLKNCFLMSQNVSVVSQDIFSCHEKIVKDFGPSEAKKLLKAHLKSSKEITLRNRKKIFEKLRNL